MAGRNLPLGTAWPGSSVRLSSQPAAIPVAEPVYGNRRCSVVDENVGCPGRRARVAGSRLARRRLGAFRPGRWRVRQRPGGCLSFGRPRWAGARDIACHHLAGADEPGRSCHQRLQQALHVRYEHRLAGVRVPLGLPQVDGEALSATGLDNYAADIARLGSVKRLELGQRGFGFCKLAGVVCIVPEYRIHRAVLLVRLSGGGLGRLRPAARRGTHGELRPGTGTGCGDVRLAWSGGLRVARAARSGRTAARPPGRLWRLARALVLLSSTGTLILPKRIYRAGRWR